jgi:hypothetical protein
MAISTSSYFSNAIIGEPQLGSDVDIYSVDSNPKYYVGFGFRRADGNRYRYCHFGALTGRATCVARNTTETDQGKVMGKWVVANLVKNNEATNPNDAGARTMQLTLTATADQFAGAYVNITAGSGSGFTYRIAGNTANNTPVTGDIYVYLKDPIQSL